MNAAGILGLLALTLLIALAGIRTLQRGRAERDALTYRTELGFAQPPKSRLHTRIDQALRRTAPGRALGRRLTLAGLGLSVLDTLVVAAAGFTAVAYGVGVVFGRLTGLLIAVIALAAGNLWLTNRQQARHDRFVSQLPEVARVMSNALSAGLAMPSAMAMVAEEVSNPAAGEFRQAVDAMRVGHSAEAALQELADRMPSREIGVMVNTLVVQQRAGGDLVGALRHISDTLETRKGLREELKTETSGSVAMSYMVVGLVAATLLLANVVRPGMIEQLTQTLIGRIVVVVSLILYSIGFLVIRRITRIEV